MRFLFLFFLISPLDFSYMEQHVSTLSSFTWLHKKSRKPYGADLTQKLKPFQNWRMDSYMYRMGLAMERLAKTSSFCRFKGSLMFKLARISEEKSLEDYVVCLTKLNEEYTTFLFIIIIIMMVEMTSYLESQYCLYNLEPTIWCVHIMIKWSMCLS